MNLDNQHENVYQHEYENIMNMNIKMDECENEC